MDDAPVANWVPVWIGCLVALVVPFPVLILGRAGSLERSLAWPRGEALAASWCGLVAGAMGAACALVLVVVAGPYSLGPTCLHGAALWLGGATADTAAMAAWAWARHLPREALGARVGLSALGWWFLALALAVLIGGYSVVFLSPPV